MFHLPPLPYDKDALEPFIDRATMEIHHDKHHATYVDKLNIAVENAGLENRDLEDLLANIDDVPKDARAAVQNHGGGHHNHSLFWMSLSPTPGNMSQEFKDIVEKTFGSKDELVKAMKEAGTALFGSGWVWLVQDDGVLKITTTANQDSPLMMNQIPLLGIDVWEHAYYLNYQNRRPDYLDNIFHVVDWETVASRYVS